MEIYDAGTAPNVQLKADHSPLTTADRTSHEIISSALAEIQGQYLPSSAKDGLSSIPILSEEGKNIPFEQRRQWKHFWLVDPLDGTKEFIRRNGEFTVNIALVEGTSPVAGVVFAPAQDTVYFAAEHIGAFKLVLKKEKPGNGGMAPASGATCSNASGSMDEKDFCRCLRTESLCEVLDASVKLPLGKDTGRDESCYTVIASRSHMNEETDAFIRSLGKKHGRVRMVSAGSSLKICLVAEGKADCYPRLGPTMEWDTAAAHAVAGSAGKKVIIFDSMDELVYNKENLMNPWFVVK